MSVSAVCGTPSGYSPEVAPCPPDAFFLHIEERLERGFEMAKELPWVSRMEDGGLIWLTPDKGPLVLRDGVWVPMDGKLPLEVVSDSRPLSDSEIRALISDGTLPQ